MKYAQTLAWKPKVKDRPRVTKQGVAYTPKATLLAERQLASQYDGPTFEGPVDVAADFTDTQVFWTISDAPDFLNRRLRGDLDNYFKLLADSLNGIAYIDDRQIVSFSARKL